MNDVTVGASARALRVVFLLPAVPAGPGGGTRVVCEYASRLAARGHEVTLVAPQRPALGGQGGWKRRVASALLRPSLGRVSRWQWMDGRVRWRRVPALRPALIPAADALIATSWPTAEVLGAASPERGRKFYLVQGNETTWAGDAERVEATWRLPMTKIVVAKWLEELGRTLGAKDIHCIPNAVNSEVFRVLRPITGRRACVAMMISHLAVKGSQDGIDALQRVRGTRPGLEVVLFGKVPFFRHPRWMRYCWNPPVARLVGEIYNRAGIFVCPSWEEGFGLPGAEAMACGCALASTDCLGVREYAKHGVNALFSPPKDVAALANNIGLLLDDDALRQRLAAAGAAAMADFGWEDRAERFERLLLSRCQVANQRG